MVIHEYGNTGSEKILVLHPMLLTGAFSAKFLAPLSERYCIIAPDLSAHGQAASSEFISAENEAAAILRSLKEKGYTDIALMLGISLGARVALELLKDDSIQWKCIVLDGAPVYKNARFLRFVYNIIFLSKWKKARKCKGIAQKKMTALFGEAGEVMGNTFENMSEKSLRNIISACSRFDFYPYSKDVQQRMYFEFGSKEIDARQAKTILRRYPFVHIALHKGYGHCQYMAAEKKAYRAMLEKRIKESV